MTESETSNVTFDDMVSVLAEIAEYTGASEKVLALQQGLPLHLSLAVLLKRGWVLEINEKAELLITSAFRTLANQVGVSDEELVAVHKGHGMSKESSESLPLSRHFGR